MQHAFPSKKSEPVVTFEPEYHMYICRQSPNFKFRLVDGPPLDIYAQFEVGVWKTKDENLAKIMDEFIATQPHISALVQKVDWAAAKRVAHDATIEHQAKTRSIKGATSTTELNAAKAATTIDEQIGDMRRKGATEEQINKFKEGLAAVGMTGISTHVDLPDDTKVADPAISQVPVPEQGIVTEKTLGAPTKILFGTGAKAS